MESVQVQQYSLPLSEASDITNLKEAVESISSDYQHKLTSIAEKYIKKFKQATECYLDHCDLSLPEILVFHSTTGPVKIQDIEELPDVMPYSLVEDNFDRRIGAAFDGCSPDDPFDLRYKNDDCMVSYYFEVPDLNARGRIRPCAIRLRYYDSLIRVDCIKKTLGKIAEEYTPVLEDLFWDKGF